MKKKIFTMLMAGILTAALTAAGGCGSAASDGGGKAEAAEETADADSDDADDETQDDADEGDDEGDDGFTLEELQDLEEEGFTEAEFDGELEDYFDANAGENLLKNHKNLLFTENLKSSSGADIYSYDMYVSADQLLIRYADGNEEFSNGGEYDGYDADLKAPYRYVFYDEESREDQKSTFDEFLYFWPGEGAEEKIEEGDTVTFKGYIRDASMIEMLLYEQEEEIAEGDYVERDLVFNKDTREFVSASGKYYKADGTSVDIASCSLSFDGEEMTPDKAYTDLLNSSDTHSLTMTVDPGTEEVVMTSTVGKGCTFYPVLYDGYIFYTDKDCTQEADENIWDETDKDLTLWAVSADDEDLDGEELVLDADEMDDIELEDGEGEELTEEELEALFDDEDVEG